MRREWLLGGAFVVLLVGIFLGGFATHAFLATSPQGCVVAWKATHMLVQKIMGYDHTDRWVVKVAFVPTDWQRRVKSLDEAQRFPYMTFYSDGGELETSAPMNMAFWSSGKEVGVNVPLRVCSAHESAVITQGTP